MVGFPQFWTHDASTLNVPFLKGSFTELMVPPFQIYKPDSMTLKMETHREFPVVRTRGFHAGAQVQSLGRELRSHKLRPCLPQKRGETQWSPCPGWPALHLSSLTSDPLGSGKGSSCFRSAGLLGMEFPTMGCWVSFLRTPPTPSVPVFPSDLTSPSSEEPLFTPPSVNQELLSTFTHTCLHGCSTSKSPLQTVHPMRGGAEPTRLTLRLPTTASAPGGEDTPDERFAPEWIFSSQTGFRGGKRHDAGFQSRLSP